MIKDTDSSNFVKLLEELRQPPNLMSLFRVLLGPVVLYLLAIDSQIATLWTVGIFLLAAVSDGLDGYLARRMNRMTKFGIALDPLADKLFAVAVALGLILYRQFPIWLALIIVGRDLLILIGGLWLLRKHDLVIQANLTGKYAFVAILTLLGSYVIRFQFGIELMTWLSLALIAISLINYGRVYTRVLLRQPIPQWTDRLLYKSARATATVALIVILALKLYDFIFRAS